MDVNSILVCSVVNVIHFRLFVENRFLSDVLYAIGNPSLLSVLGSRLLINLKEAGELGLDGGTKYRPNLQTISDIEFSKGGVKGLYLHLFLKTYSSC